MPAIISTIVYGSFIVSTLSTTLSNISANDTIRRGGNEIDNSKTTFMEKLNYFITDFAFLLVPIYNVYKSIYKNRIKKTPSEYTSERKAMLKNRTLLRSIEVKKENTTKEETKERNQESSKPTTGDNIAVYLGVFAISSMVIVWIIVYRKMKSYSKKMK